MKKVLVIPALIGAMLLALVLLPAKAVTAKTVNQTDSDDPVARGEYLVTAIGCVDCHSPIDETGIPLPDQLYAGGRPFDLGPLGVVYTKNITQDKETGLGDWTDDEIKDAIATGVSKDGLHLFPVMPYLYFNNLADQDLDDIVAYMRTIKPIKNSVERRQILPPEQLPHLTRRTGVVAPDPTDTAARGQYLMTAALTCGDCHTPVNPETLQPVLEKNLAGGQPFEGPWGIVYGGNITPDTETGIGAWTEADITRLIRTGVRPDGRVTIVMPWQVYTNLSDDDLKAAIYFLKNDVKPVQNVVPAADLKEGFEQYVELAQPAAPETPWALLAAVAGAVILLAGGAYLVLRRPGSAAK